MLNLAIIGQQVSTNNYPLDWVWSAPSGHSIIELKRSRVATTCNFVIVESVENVTLLLIESVENVSPLYLEEIILLKC